MSFLQNISSKAKTTLFEAKDAIKADALSHKWAYGIGGGVVALVAAMGLGLIALHFAGVDVSSAAGNLIGGSEEIVAGHLAHAGGALFTLSLLTGGVALTVRVVILKRKNREGKATPPSNNNSTPGPFHKPNPTPERRFSRGLHLEDNESSEVEEPTPTHVENTESSEVEEPTPTHVENTESSDVEENLEGFDPLAEIETLAHQFEKRNQAIKEENNLLHQFEELAEQVSKSPKPSASASTGNNGYVKIGSKWVRRANLKKS